jgi:hypothetical protein
MADSNRRPCLPGMCSYVRNGRVEIRNWSPECCSRRPRSRAHPAPQSLRKRRLHAADHRRRCVAPWTSRVATHLVYAAHQVSRRVWVRGATGDLIGERRPPTARSGFSSATRVWRGYYSCAGGRYLRRCPGPGKCPDSIIRAPRNWPHEARVRSALQRALVGQPPSSTEIRPRAAVTAASA